MEITNSKYAAFLRLLRSAGIVFFGEGLLKFLQALGYYLYYFPFSELAASLFPLFAFPVVAVLWSKKFRPRASRILKALLVEMLKFLGLYVILVFCVICGNYLGNFLTAVVVGFEMLEFTLHGPAKSGMLLGYELLAGTMTYGAAVLILLIKCAVKCWKLMNATMELSRGQAV